jgi:predicted lactoylglutathione lyase
MARTITSLVLEAPDVAEAEAFYAALGVGDRVGVRETQAQTSGFRGYTISLVCPHRGNVDAFVAAATGAGATVLKPAKKSFWGYGAIVQAPDGAIWKFATSSKKDTGTAEREYDDMVLLLGVEDVKATKQFYVDHGLTVGKSFGSKYAEFEAPAGAIGLGLYPRRAAAKEAGVDVEGSGSHRIAVISDSGTFTDPDGLVWEASTADEVG